MTPKTIRQQVRDRAKCCCEYCWSQENFSPTPFSIEHIIPICKGGTDTLENLAWSCQGCNNHKYTYTQVRDPVTQKKCATVSSPQRSMIKTFCMA